MEKTREFAIAILDLFEDLLDEKDINIPSEDRVGEEGEARLYGTEYFQLEDGYETVDDLMNRECPCWDVDKLVEKAFPKSWKVSRYEYDGTVEC